MNKKKTLVVIASHNPVKIRAVEKAFALQFPGQDIEFVACSASSDVSDQPLSDEETRRGARNRAQNAAKAHRHADFCIGLEGGIENMNGQLVAFAWMAALGKDTRIADARTVTLPLPAAVKLLLDEGLELGEANDRVFSTINSKQQGGAFGLLTNGLYTREQVYIEALVMALVPFVNPLYKLTVSDTTEPV